MKFNPSEHSYGDYGWSASYPLAALTVSGTASARGLSNQPTSAAHKSNLSLLSDFLDTLPFTFRVNSAYRSSEVNAAVGGATKSQHLNGLAVDLTPRDISNEQAATWLYANQAKYPMIDQVIWYTDTHHVHISICPSGAVGCAKSAGARREFLQGQKEGGVYIPWAPTAAARAAMAARYISNRPIMGVGLLWGAFAGFGALTLGSLYLLKRWKKQHKVLQPGV